MKSSRAPIDRALLDAILVRAANLLDRVAQREAFHVRMLAERLADTWNATALPVHELATFRGVPRSSRPADGGRPTCEGSVDRNDTQSTRLRVILSARAESLRAQLKSELPERLTLDEVLRTERARSANAKYVIDRLGSQLEGAGPWPSDEGAIRSALIMLAAQLASMLELRILAERTGDPVQAALLDAERNYWIEVARTVVARALDRAPVAPRDGSETRLRPLAGRVVLSVARAPLALGELSGLLESAGATTILAESRASALSLLRWFHVDAALCSIDREESTLLDLPRESREQTKRAPAPLWVALLGSKSEISPERASALGFDAALPLSLAERDGLTVAVALAIQARRVTRRAAS